MEKSNQINYNTTQPTAHPGVFVNSGYQPDFNQWNGSAPPPQQTFTTFPTHMPTTQQNSNDSYCSRWIKNRRQTSSIAGGLLLMLISGLHIGWGIWRTEFLGLWSSSLSISLRIVVLMSWSMGAFLGGFIGAALTPILNKNYIYYLTGAVMIVGNLLFIIWDEDIEAIIAGRILIGAAHGITYVTLITHAGENAASNMRGTILSTINFLLYLGIMASVTATGTVRFGWFGPVTLSAERIVAIMGVLLAVASIACTIMMTVESVPFLLHSNRREHAMINLKRLRNSNHETFELTHEMEEFNSMVIEDKRNSCNIFTNGNAKPLVLMVIMRLMVALTNNFLINVVTIAFVSQIFYFYQYRLVPIAVVAPRLFMSILQIFYADVFKRKTQVIGSSALAGIMVIVGGILLNFLRASSFHQLWVFGIIIAVFWLTFQLVCSIGMDQMQDVYLSEAFSTAKKPWSITFVTGIEHIFHIFMIGMFFVGINTLFQLNVIIFVSGATIIIFGLILATTLPETRNMSLKRAKDAFINHSFIQRSFAFCVTL